MKDLLTFIAQSLVEFPDQVSVTEVDKENATVLELRVAESDMGKVIGKQGKIAKAIRTIIRTASVKEPKKVIVEII